MSRILKWAGIEIRWDFVVTVTIIRWVDDVSIFFFRASNDISIITTNQHRPVVTTNSNAYPYVLFNDNVPNIVPREHNASMPLSMPPAVSGRIPRQHFRQYQAMHIPRSPTHNVINISSSDEDSQAMPINLSRKRMLRDAATVCVHVIGEDFSFR